MSLKVNKGWQTYAKWAFWAVLAVLLAAFLVRVLIFEHNYYNEKEGSERHPVEIIEGEEPLVEVAPTPTEVKEYIVAPDRPRYLSIEKLKINKARVLPMGVNTKGELDTPRNIFDVGWYEASGKPGLGGTMIIDGHNGGPRVYGDGLIFKYAVKENVEIPLSEADAYMTTAARSPEPGKESLTLITCTGAWGGETYLSRQFTRAVLVEN